MKALTIPLQMGNHHDIRDLVVSKTITGNVRFTLGAESFHLPPEMLETILSGFPDMEVSL